MVSAVLNMGWCKQAHSDDWIKNGDYHTATQVDFEAPSGESPINLDVPVQQFVIKTGKSLEKLYSVLFVFCIYFKTALNRGSVRSPLSLIGGRKKKENFVKDKTHTSVSNGEKFHVV